MQFRLRTLLIVLAIGPKVLAVGWTEYFRRRNEARWQEVISKAIPAQNGRGLIVVSGDFSSNAYESPP